MFTKLFSQSIKCALAAAVVASLQPALSLADPLASDTVSVKVSAAGLDVNSAAGAQELYKRLTIAAEQACGVEAEFDALRTAKFDRCYRDTLGNAVHAINRPLLTQVYVERHSRDDAARSVAASERVAAK